jgi:hypothetical protein
VNTSPANPGADPVCVEQPTPTARLPRFLLSAVQPCEVVIVPDVSEQSPPSKTQAELLADGQCEV